MTAADAMTIDTDVLDTAARTVADAFGLGDATLVSGAWPVEEGDTVLSAPFEGALTGRLFLAVNDAVAARLAGDPGRLAAGLDAALEVVRAHLGVDAVLGEPDTSTEVPVQTVEINDGNQLCALFAIRVVAGDDASRVDAGDDPVGDIVGDETVEHGAAAGDPAVAAFTPHSFEHATSTTMTTASGPLDLLQEVDMEVTVELGRTTMPIRELLSLQPGMVVEIDRAAGSPIDVLVNGRLIACGEVVVIDEEFGIRITEIVGSHH